MKNDDFLTKLFDRARTIDAIIAEAPSREFARILKAAKGANTSSILLDGYVDRIKSAKRIPIGKKPWVSVLALFENRGRDLDVFHWVLEAEPDDVAVDESGGLYISPTLANSALCTDRQNLRLRNKDQKIIILVLVGVLVLLAIRVASGASS